jgi:ribose/xylose/arabinose/galactoside ABC-type transport system permease subunit
MNDVMLTQKASTKTLFARIIEVREIGVLIPLIVCVVAFSLMNNRFYSMENIINVLRSTSFVFIAGVGMTYLLVSGAFDLSVGPQLAFSGIITGMLMQAGVSISISILIAIVLGCLIGSANGFCSVKLNIPPFIATLGMMYALKGVALIVRKGVPVYPLPDQFNAIGQGSLIGIPYVVIIAAVLGFIGHLILENTVYGRMLYAVGGNSETSRLAGIPVNKIKLSAFILVGAMSALSGILMTARLGSAQPGAGVGFELLVITSAIIGGTSLFGGAGTLFGTAFGALFMTILTNGMTMIRISPYWQQLVLGIVIIISVAIDQYRITRRGR